MKGFFFIVGILFLSNYSFAAFSYKRTITVDHTKVPSTQSSFPVLISTDTVWSGSLATVANGGKVQNANGYDIGFYTGSDCSTGKLNWENEDYSATTGISRYWVNIASLSSSADTVIYLCYGDASISTFQGGSTGSVWDTNYKGVYHLPNGTSLSANDSTVNVANGTLVNTPTASTGQIDGAGNFVAASSQYISTPTVPPTSTFTLSAWVKESTTSTDGLILNTNFNGSSVPYMLCVGTCVSVYAGVAFFNGGWHQSGHVTDVRADGKWHYVVGTYDGTTLSFYVDGALDASAPASGVPAANTNTFNIGRYINDGVNQDGIIDEARISNITRSANWITTEYRNQYSPQTFYSVGAETTFGPSVYSPNNRGLLINGGKVKINGGKIYVL